MKFTMLLFLLSFIIISCDAPVRTRVQDGVGTVTSGTGTSSVTNPDGTVSTAGNGVLTTDGTTTTSTAFPDCEYLSAQYNGGDLGYFGLCQGTNSNQFQTVLAETQHICFVPVHILTSGNSYKIGKPECITTPIPDQVYAWTFTKDTVAPYNYTRTEEVNGVMVIKRESLDPYLTCMSAKEDYLVAAGCCSQTVYNSSTGKYNCINPNSACLAAGDSEAAFRCGQFTQYHSNNYRQVDFRY